MELLSINPSNIPRDTHHITTEPSVPSHTHADRQTPLWYAPSPSWTPPFCEREREKEKERPEMSHSLKMSWYYSQHTFCWVPFHVFCPVCLADSHVERWQAVLASFFFCKSAVSTRICVCLRLYALGRKQCICVFWVSNPWPCLYKYNYYIFNSMLAFNFSIHFNVCLL